MINELIVQLNSNCNLNCCYCYSKNKFIIDKKNIRESVRKIIKNYKTINTITITGGEPFLEYDFLVEILEMLKSKKIKKMILTNGLLLTNSIINKIKSLDTELRISIDSIDNLVVGEKKPSKELVKIIKKNKNYLRYASKVITKKNLKDTYRDFLRLAELGFKDIDIIPQMYVYWNDKEIEFMVREIKKIFKYSLKNRITINLMKNNKNRYYNCNKIRVLPDGDISFCNSLNSSKKAYFIKKTKLSEFEKFKNKAIKAALEELHKKKWFKKEHLDLFCMVDAFYYSFINNKDYKWAVSSINLFSKLNKTIKKGN